MAILSPAAAELVVNWPSGWVLLALAPLVVLLLGLIAFCLVDLVRAPSVRLLPKAVWALIIVLFSAPFGAILYLAVGRVPRSANRPTPDGAPGPECDPVADPINRPDEGLLPLGRPEHPPRRRHQRSGRRLRSIPISRSSGPRSPCGPADSPGITAAPACSMSI